MAELRHRDAATPSTDVVCAECTAIAQSAGIESALAWLNARTRFRFSGIYQVDPPHLRNLVLFDRENPGLNVSGEVTRLDDTYCAFAASAGAFETSDSHADERLTAHASREAVISYAGVAMRRPNGQVWGTLCHFDVRPRLLPQAERAHLDSVAAMFSELLQVAGQPAPS